MPSNKPRQPTQKQTKKSSISIEGNVSKSAIVAGDNNQIQILTNNEQERKIASDLVAVNELINAKQLKKAEKLLAEIKALNIDFPGLETAYGKLEAAKRRYRNWLFGYAAMAVAVFSLMGRILLSRNKEALCQTSEKYYLNGILALNPQNSGEDTMIWVGDSNHGLAIKSLDGKVLKSFGEDELGSSSITVVEFDKTRNGMWVGTGGGGLAFIDSSQNVQKRFTIKDGLPGCKITDIIVTAKGIYTTTIAGKGMGFSEDGNIWKTYQPPQDYPTGSNFDIYNATPDRDGTIWVSSYQDAYQWDGENWKQYAPENTPTVVHAIAIDQDAIKWVGTIKGLYLLSTDAGTQWSGPYTTKDGLSNNNITQITFIGTGRALIGTEKGLNICEKAGGNLGLKCKIYNSTQAPTRINVIAWDGIHAFIGSTANDFEVILKP